MVDLPRTPCESVIPTSLLLPVPFIVWYRYTTILLVCSALLRENRGYLLSIVSSMIITSYLLTSGVLLGNHDR